MAEQTFWRRNETCGTVAEQPFRVADRGGVTVTFVESETKRYLSQT